MVLKSQNLIRSPGFGLCYGFGSGSGFGLVFGFDVGFGVGFGCVLGLGLGFVVGSGGCSVCIPPIRVVDINTQKTKKGTPVPGAGDPYLTP